MPAAHAPVRGRDAAEFDRGMGLPPVIYDGHLVWRAAPAVQGQAGGLGPVVVAVKEVLLLVKAMPAMYGGVAV